MHFCYIPWTWYTGCLEGHFYGASDWNQLPWPGRIRCILQVWQNPRKGRWHVQHRASAKTEGTPYPHQCERRLVLGWVGTSAPASLQVGCCQVESMTVFCLSSVSTVHRSLVSLGRKRIVLLFGVSPCHLMIFPWILGDRLPLLLQISKTGRGSQ